MSTRDDIISIIQDPSVVTVTALVEYVEAQRADERAKILVYTRPGQPPVLLEDAIAEAAPAIRADERARNVRNYGGSVSVAAIEAEVRERIAEAIEAHSEKVGKVDPPPQQDDYYAACHDAAAIARGDT